MPGEELGCEVDRQVSATAPLLLDGFVVNAGVDVEAKDHVVKRDARVESTVLVEVDDLIDLVRGRVLSNVREGAAVAHGVDRLAVESEKLADAYAVEPLTL